MRLYELFWLINSSKFGRKFLVCPKAVTDLKNSQYYPLETPIGKTQITISTSKLFQIFHTRFQILDSNIIGMSEWIITGENMVLSLYYKHFDGLWIHKLSSTHMLEKLIEFGWDDYDDWKLTSLDGTVFVAEIALDKFSWRFVPFKTRGVTVFCLWYLILEKCLW